MAQLTFEQWKQTYMAQVTQEKLDVIQSHGVTNPLELIEKLQLEAYNKYLDGSYQENES